MVLLCSLCVFLVWVHSAPPVAVARDDPCSAIYSGVGKPVAETPRAATELCRSGYLLSFNHFTRIADWVMERLTPASLQGAADRKYSSFRADPDLEGAALPRLADYRGSGYDRGHLAPAGDMKWDQQAMDESFYLSNIAPQVGIGFNRGIWARLEAKIRDQAREDHDLVVITGPVFFDFEPRIGGGVVVPDAYFKIIFNPADLEAQAFLLPNRKTDEGDLAIFQVSIREVEALTGFDFLSLLPPLVQDALETKIYPHT